MALKRNIRDRVILLKNKNKKTKENDIMIKYLDLNGVEITDETKSVFYHNGKYKSILIPCFYNFDIQRKTKELIGFEDTMMG